MDLFFIRNETALVLSDTSPEMKNETVVVVVGNIPPSDADTVAIHLENKGFSLYFTIIKFRICRLP